MKLAVFFPNSLWSAWCVSHGLVNTLRRMGHEVEAVPVAPGAPMPNQLADGVEGVILSGPEHLKPSKKFSVPSVAWMHETIEREDYGRLNVDAIKRSADVVFCPGIQDEKYGFRFLPFGADTEIFHADPLQPKTRDCAFIGLMYPKRQEFLKKLQPHMNGTKLTVGNVQVLEVDGINPRKTAELYALNLRSIKVFVNLPTLSQLAVTKIYEVLACGTALLTPAVNDMRNLEGLPIDVYHNPIELAAMAKSILQRDRREHELANFGKQNSLELRCEKLIAALKEAA